MRSLKGGNVKLEAVPIESYGFEYGGNESENAAKMLYAMADKQNSLNNTLSGGRSKRLKRGGSNGTSAEYIVIPQFPSAGLQVSSQTANTASLQSNSTFINAQNNAMNDQKIEHSQRGGKIYRRKKNKSKKHKKTNKSKCRGKSCKKYKQSPKH
jgi:hypothetical protein